jgi:hypothetical protein
MKTEAEQIIENYRALKEADCLQAVKNDLRLSFDRPEFSTGVPKKNSILKELEKVVGRNLSCFGDPEDIAMNIEMVIDELSLHQKLKNAIVNALDELVDKLS